MRSPDKPLIHFETLSDRPRGCRMTEALISAAKGSQIHETGSLQAIVQGDSVDYRAEALKLGDAFVLLRLHAGPAAPN